MGGISTGFDGTTKTPFTGGVPRRDWTGLMSPTNEHVFPMQLRPTSQSAYMKVDSTLQLKSPATPSSTKGLI